jgi:SOS-response transcriptional repressor LexA
MKTDIGKRFSEIRENSHLNKQHFADSIKIPSTTVSDIELSKREPSKDVLLRLASKYRVNLHWMLTGDGEKYVNEVPKKEEKHPFIVELEAIVDKKLEKIEAQIAQIEGQLKKKSIDGPYSGSFVSEQEPEYDVMYKKIQFVENIAAGPPIQQSEDLSEYIDVPERFIKTKSEDYYAARIRGESMTAAGIPDGCTVLIRRSDVPRDGAIQVVRRGGSSTLKRMREGEDHTWTLHLEDNSERLIPIRKDEDYQVQGDFVAVLPEKS